MSGLCPRCNSTERIWIKSWEESGEHPSEYHYHKWSDYQCEVCGLRYTEASR